MRVRFDHGQMGEDTATRPVIKYLQQGPKNLSKPIYWVAIRPTFWDNKDLYPDIPQTI